jgi:hypothetical protein
LGAPAAKTGHAAITDSVAETPAGEIAGEPIRLRFGELAPAGIAAKPAYKVITDLGGESAEPQPGGVGAGARR